MIRKTLPLLLVLGLAACVQPAPEADPEPVIDENGVEALPTDDVITEDVTGTVDLFDEAVQHEITLSYTQDDYDRMLDAYFTEGEKEWMVADITIDPPR